jgi:hypothetical protein
MPSESIRVRGLIGRRGEPLDRGLQRRRAVGALQAAVGERGEEAGGLLEGEPGLVRDEADLLEAQAEALHVGGRRVRGGGEHVGDVADVLAFQLEDVHGLRGDRGRRRQVHLPGRGEAQRPGQGAAHDVGGGDAGLRQLRLGLGRLGGRELGVLARLDGEPDRRPVRSLPVALETALTSDICLSKSMLALPAYPARPSSAAPATPVAMAMSLSFFGDFDPRSSSSPLKSRAPFLPASNAAPSDCARPTRLTVTVRSATGHLPRSVAVGADVDAAGV